MKLTHTRNHSLTALFVSLHSEGGVFFSELRKTSRELIEILLSLRFNSDTDNGIGEVHRFEYDRSTFFSEGVTSADVFETYTCADITSTNHFNRILLVRVHLEEARNAFLLTRTYVVNVRTSFYLTRVNTEEGETTYVGVSSNLKRESRSLFVFRRLASFSFTSVRVYTFDSWSVKRRGEEHHHVVEESLHTLVLERRTAGHRNDVECERTLTDSSNHFFFSEAVGIFEELLHKSFVLLCSKFDHLLAPFVAFVNEFSGDVFYVIFSTHCLIVPKDSLHADEVNDTSELFFSTDGHRDNARSCTEDVLHLAHHFKEVSTRTVHLVHITDTRYIVLVSLTPYSFRLRFNTTYCAISSDSTIEHTE